MAADARLYQDLWEGAGVALLLLDPSSRILAANAGVSRLSGYDQAELLDSGMGILVTEPDLLMARQMRLALRRGERYLAHVPWRRKDGTTLSVEMTGIPVDMYGQSMALVLCRESVAAQEGEAALRARVSQLESLYLASALMITDLDVSKLLNRLAEQVCLLTSATISGLYVYDMDRDVLVLEAAHGIPDSAVGKELSRDEGVSWRSFTERRVINTHRYGELPDAIDLAAKFAFESDRYQQVPLIAVPMLWQDEAFGVLILAEPGSGQTFGAIDEYVGGLLANQVSMAIRQAKLYAELHASSEALARANTALLALDRMKDDFLSMVSHELQQPLATARLGIDLVLQQRDALDERQSVLLERALRSIDNQNHLINDLLFLVDLRGPGEAYEDMVDLGDVVRAVVDAMMPAAEAKGLQVDMHLAAEPTICHVATLALERVVEHLLGNAIKFTSRGRISVAVRSDIEAGEAVLDITDSGIGISEAQQRRIFESFYQVESSSTRSYEGLGLGLALVRRIVDLYGGRITVQSRQGQGSRFMIAFPLVSS